MMFDLPLITDSLLVAGFLLFVHSFVFVANLVLLKLSSNPYLAYFFFFSSRRRHTRFKCDWSSDVCSSDLNRILIADPRKLQNVKPPFPRISYEDAIKVLQKHGNPAKFGDDIGGDEETIIFYWKRGVWGKRVEIGGGRII